jgi:NADH-quinone oxidoreductase subunit J
MLSISAFLLLAFVMLLAAFSCVTARNEVHAAYWLLACALAAAGLVWFLGAEYIAILQLLVYAGAVGILVVFTVMVTHRNYADAERPAQHPLPALACTVALFALLAYGILSSRDLAGATTPASALDLATFGAELFAPEGWTLAFELASLILTVALVAAVWWTRDTDEDRQETDRQEQERGEDDA